MSNRDAETCTPLNENELRLVTHLVNRVPCITRVLDFTSNLLAQHGCVVQITRNGKDIGPKLPKEGRLSVATIQEIQQHNTKFAVEVHRAWLTTGVAPTTGFVTRNSTPVPVVLPMETVSLSVKFDETSDAMDYTARRKPPDPMYRDSTDGSLISKGPQIGGIRLPSIGFSDNVTTQGLPASRTDNGQSYNYIAGSQDVGYGDDNIVVIPSPTHPPLRNGRLTTPIASLIPAYLQLQIALRAYVAHERRVANPVVYQTKQATPASVQTAIMSTDLPPSSALEDSRTAPLVIHQAEQQAVFEHQKRMYEDIMLGKQIHMESITDVTDALPLSWDIFQFSKEAISDTIRNPIPLPEGVSLQQMAVSGAGANLKFLIENFERLACTVLQVPQACFEINAINENAGRFAMKMLRDTMMTTSRRLEEVMTNIFKATFMDDMTSSLESIFFRRWLSKNGADEIVQLARTSERTLSALIQIGHQDEFFTEAEIRRLHEISNRPEKTLSDAHYVQQLLRRFPSVRKDLKQIASAEMANAALDELYRHLLLNASQESFTKMLEELPYESMESASKSARRSVDKSKDIDVTLSLPCTYGVDTNETMKLLAFGLVSADEAFRMTRPHFGLSVIGHPVPQENLRRLESLPKKVFDALVEKMSSDAAKVIGVASNKPGKPTKAAAPAAEKTPSAVQESEKEKEKSKESKTSEKSSSDTSEESTKASKKRKAGDSKADVKRVKSS